MVGPEICISPGDSDVGGSCRNTTVNVVVETLFLQFSICAGDNSRPPLKGWIYLVWHKHNPSFHGHLAPFFGQGCLREQTVVSTSLLPSAPVPTLCFTLSGTPAPDSKLTNSQLWEPGKEGKEVGPPNSNFLGINADSQIQVYQHILS